MPGGPLSRDRLRTCGEAIEPLDVHGGVHAGQQDPGVLEALERLLTVGGKGVLDQVGVRRRDLDPRADALD